METIWGAIIGATAALLGVALTLLGTVRHEWRVRLERRRAWLSTLSIDLASLGLTLESLEEESDEVEPLDSEDESMSGLRMDISAYEEFRREGFLAEVRPELAKVVAAACVACRWLNERIDDRDQIFLTTFTTPGFHPSSMQDLHNRILDARAYARDCVATALAELAKEE